MILIVDNYDSFTYNLYQQIAAFGHNVEVVAHDKLTSSQVQSMKPTHIVISPGPGRPRDSANSLAIIKQFYETTPILGVCLGHQGIGELFGSRVVEAPVIIHGKPDTIYHNESGLFNGLPATFEAARYNSLVIDKTPDDFKLTAWSGDGSIMAIEHRRYPLYGIQFHPESFMTPHGNTIMENFLLCSA